MTAEEYKNIENDTYEESQTGFCFIGTSIKGQEKLYTLIKHEYDIIIDDLEIDNTLRINQSYRDLYNKICETTNIPIIIGDCTTVATMPAFKNKYENIKYLMLDSQLRLHANDDDISESYLYQVLFNNYFNNDIKTNQLIYYGPEKIDVDHDIITYTQNKIKKDQMNKYIINSVFNNIVNQPTFITINGSIFNIVKKKKILELLTTVAPYVVGVEIINFERKHKNIIGECLLSLFSSLKEHKINIFTEDSKFLIYRPLIPTDPENDIGWYILRYTPTNIKNALMNEIGDDCIISKELDGVDYLLATTTINDQNQKTYYYADNVMDLTLFPQEKQMMCFELIN